MEGIDNLAPSVATEFKKVIFVVQKTQRQFSAIPVDQAHEQNNKIMIGDGGAIGLTENSSQLLIWILAQNYPELSSSLSRRSKFSHNLKEVRKVVTTNRQDRLKTDFTSKLKLSVAQSKKWETRS
jgi:hypothetical protein